MRKSFNLTSPPHTSRDNEKSKNFMASSQQEFGAMMKKDAKIELKDVQNEIRTIKSIFGLVKQAVN